MSEARSVPADHPSIAILRAVPITVPQRYVEAASACGDPVVEDLEGIAKDALTVFESHQEACSTYDLLVRDPETGILALVGIDVSFHRDAEPDVGSARTEYGDVEELCRVLSRYTEADPERIELVRAMAI